MALVYEIMSMNITLHVYSLSHVSATHQFAHKICGSVYFFILRSNSRLGSESMETLDS